MEPDRDPAFNPNIFSEDEEEAAQAAASSVSATPSVGAGSSKSAFQSVGRGAVVPPEPQSGVNVAFCSVVTSPVGAGKKSPPPAELSLAAAAAQSHVIVNGGCGSQSPLGGGHNNNNPTTASPVVNGRPSPISSSNTIVDLSAINDATPTGAAPLAITIAPALPGVAANNARRLRGVEGSPPASVNSVAASTNPLLPQSQCERGMIILSSAPFFSPSPLWIRPSAYIPLLIFLSSFHSRFSAIHSRLPSDGIRRDANLGHGSQLGLPPHFSFPPEQLSSSGLRRRRLLPRRPVHSQKHQLRDAQNKIAR